MPAVGDEGLAAVQHIVRPVRTLDGGGLDALQITARGGLAHGDGAHHGAAGHLGQVLLFLRLRAVVQDVRRHDFAVQAKADTRGACTRQLFHLRHRVQLVGPGAAVFLGQAHAQKAVGACLAPHLARHVALVFPVGVVGRHFFLDKAAKAVGKGLVVGLEEGAFDHGGATRLFMQSYCLVKFCHRLSPDAPPETQKPPEGGLREAGQALMA